MSWAGGEAEPVKLMEVPYGVIVQDGEIVRTLSVRARNGGVSVMIETDYGQPPTRRVWVELDPEFAELLAEKLARAIEAASR